MRCQTLASGFIALLLPHAAVAIVGHDILQIRDISAQQLCEPAVEAGTQFGALPPCSQARIIEDEVCKMSDLGQHAECMCQGHDFFPLKLACDECIMGHAGMSQREQDFYGNILGQAQDKLCHHGNPEQSFASIWSEVRDAATMPTTGNTELVDSLGSPTGTKLSQDVVTTIIVTPVDEDEEEDDDEDDDEDGKNEDNNSGLLTARPGIFQTKPDPSSAGTVFITKVADYDPRLKATIRGTDGLLTGLAPYSKANFTGTSIDPKYTGAVGTGKLRGFNTSDFTDPQVLGDIDGAGRAVAVSAAGLLVGAGAVVAAALL